MSTPDDSKPSWLTEDCPAWCVVEHHESDFAEDRIHDSAADVFTVLVTPPGLEADIADPESTEFVAQTSRLVGERTEWVFIGEEHRRRQHLQISRESAYRLIDALQKHLDSVR